MWKNAKELVKENNPGLEETTPEFIEKALVAYASITKVASVVEIMDALCKENVVTKNGKLEFNKYRSEVDILKKTAGIGDFLAKHQHTLGTIGNTALGVGAAALVAGGVNAIGQGTSNLYHRMMRKPRLEKIFKYNPHLRNVDQDRLNQTISDIEDLNPGMSKSPIVMGTLLSDAMTEDGIHLDKAKGIHDLRNDSSNELKPLELKLFKTKNKEQDNWGKKLDKREKKKSKFYEKTNFPKQEFEYKGASSKLISASKFF